MKETGTDDGPRGLGQLAADLVRLARSSPAELSRRIATLTVAEQAELALRLKPVERLELLLHAPRPLRLVRALPDADLYLTVREIGPADATPLLALASSSQLIHLIDLEAWRGDRFDAKRAGAWIALFLESGEPCVVRFLRQADDELIVLLFQRWIRVEQIEFEDGAEKYGHGQGEAGTERGPLTPDGHHSFRPAIAEHLPAIRRILQLLYVGHRERYARVVWNALWELPAEVEEAALHWRQSRLEQHGFPDWEQALAVYAPPGQPAVRVEPPGTADPEGGLPASRASLMVLPRGDVLVSAIDALGDDERERVLFETVALANKLLVADGADTGEPAAHRGAMEKAAGYVGIALELRGVGVPAAAAETLRASSVLELFRQGYAQAVELQRRARQLVDRGWPTTHPRAVELLDSPIRERLQALLGPRPRFLDVEQVDGDPVLREFRSTGDLAQTRVALETAEILGVLFVERLGLDVERLLRAELAPPERCAPRCFSTLLSTLLAWHAARQVLRGDPLPQPVVADFLRNVASRRTAAPDAPERALERLLRSLAETHDLAGREFAVLQAFGRFCLEKLADECGGLDPGVPVDPRRVPVLLVEP